MPQTAIYGLRYPSPDDQAGHAPVQVQNLAEDTDDMLAGLLPDTGVLANPPLSMGPGWGLTQTQYRIIGDTMELFVWLELTGTAITASSTGNIVGDPVFATITEAAKRPAFTVYGTFVASQATGQWQLDAATGQIQLVSMHSSSQIATGHTARVHAVYPLP